MARTPVRASRHSHSKTIDNDLLVTDHCPATAARPSSSPRRSSATTSTTGPSRRENQHHHGPRRRLPDCGQHSSARQRPDDGPHPGLPAGAAFDVEQFRHRRASRSSTSFGRCLVAVSEGHRRQGGQALGAEKVSVLRQEKPRPRRVRNLQLSFGRRIAGRLPCRNAAQPLQELTRVPRRQLRLPSAQLPRLPRAKWTPGSPLVGPDGRHLLVDETPAGSVALVRLPSTTYTVGTKLIGLHEVSPEKPPKTKVVGRRVHHDRKQRCSTASAEYVSPLVGDLPKVAGLEQVG